jgi:hypothetical protein
MGSSPSQVGGSFLALICEVGPHPITSRDAPKTNVETNIVVVTIIDETNFRDKRTIFLPVVSGIDVRCSLTLF